MLANLEDFWQEMEPQNVPATQAEGVNWRRKTRYPREAFTRMPAVVETLKAMSELRKRRDRRTD